MVPACHKLAWIKDVYMSSLGLRKVKQETTAPQMILFHQTT